MKKKRDKNLINTYTNLLVRLTAVKIKRPSPRVHRQHPGKQKSEKKKILKNEEALSGAHTV